jgi:hypothetical protein
MQKTERWLRASRLEKDNLMPCLRLPFPMEHTTMLNNATDVKRIHEILNHPAVLNKGILPKF